MQIQHPEIHEGCVCFQRGEKQIITLRQLARGEKEQRHLTSHSMIFVLEGSVRYSVVGICNANVDLRAGEFIFLPVSTIATREALDDATVLLVRTGNMIGKIPECRTFRFQRLSEGVSFDQVEGMDNKSIHPLEMNERVRHLVEGVVATERDGLKCANYAKHVVAQLLALIQVYYTREEYMRFYSTVASSDVVFTDTIYEKWKECRSVGELALALGMPEAKFNMRFRKIFNENPGQWLKERRDEWVYRDICSSDKTLDRIAYEHRCTKANLIRRCRETFGETPGQIRKGLTFDIRLVGQKGNDHNANSDASR